MAGDLLKPGCSKCGSFNIGTDMRGFYDRHKAFLPSYRKREDYAPKCANCGAKLTRGRKKGD